MFERFKEAIDRLLTRSDEQPLKCDARSFTLQVKCGACGEVIPVRIDRDHEVQPEYAADADEGDPPTQWRLRKEIVGSECQNLISFTLRFDCDQGLMDSSIEGGEFLLPQLDASSHENGEQS